MRVYIAGPIRKIPGFNFDAFYNATKQWRDAGHDVVSPIELDLSTDGFYGTNVIEQAMRRDIEAILTCDAVAFLPGWEHSEGSRIEYTLAKAVGLQLLDAVTFETVDDSLIYDEQEIVTCLRNQQF